MQPEIFFVTGPEIFLARTHIAKMEKGAKEKYGDFSVSRLSAAESSIGILRSEIFSPPFFGGKRVLFLWDFPPSASQKMNEEKKNALQKLVDELDTLPEGVVLFCVAPEVDKRTSLYKNLLKKAKKIEEFLPLDESQTVNWVVQEFQKKQLICPVSIAKFLVQFSGKSLFVLENEVEKLSLIVQSGEVLSEKLVQTHCVPNDELANFAFSETLSTGDPQKIIETFRQALENDAISAIWNRDVLSSLRNLLKVAIGIHTKEKSAVHPFVAQKLQNTAKKISLEQAIATWKQLALLDVGSKNGEISFAAGEDTSVAALMIEKIILELFSSSVPHLGKPYIL